MRPLRRFLPPLLLLLLLLQLVLLLCNAGATAGRVVVRPLEPHMPWRSSSSQWNPQANPQSVVRAGRARFTLLSDRMLRMEYSVEERFQEQPTWAFVNRYLPTPPFEHSRNGSWLLLSTAYLQLSYDTSSNISFCADNLRVQVQVGQERWVEWRPARFSNAQGNLFGTVRVRLELLLPLLMPLRWSLA